MLLAIATLVLLWRRSAIGFVGACVWLILSPTLVVPIVTEAAAGVLHNSEFRRSVRVDYRHVHRRAGHARRRRLRPLGRRQPSRGLALCGDGREQHHENRKADQQKDNRHNEKRERHSRTSPSAGAECSSVPRVVTVMRRQAAINRISVRCSPSPPGVACAPDDGKTAGDLFRAADARLYAAKAAGGNRVVSADG
jgi:hypothetical protein